MTNFNWRDPLNLLSDLSNEEKLVFETAQKYAEESLSPRVKEAFRNETIDKSIFSELGELGFLGLTLPEPYGAGLSYVAYGLAARAIENVCSGYRSSFSVQSSLVMYPIFKFGNDEQKNKYLPKLASGEFIGAFGLTEPNHGSDPASMETTATPTNGGYILNGNKTWITNSPIADVLIVWAKVKENSSDTAKNLSHKTIKGFIIDRHDIASGLSTPKIEGKLSLRTSVTGEIVMENLFIKESQLLESVSGLKGPFSCLNQARYGISWGAIGAAESCWLTAVDYALNRYQFDKPLAQNQLIQKKLADMQTEITLGLHASLKVGRLLDKGEASPEMISLIKRNNARKSLDISRQARDILGGNGISEDYPIMRHLVNLETVNTYEGTEDVHALILGRSQTGLSAF